MLAIIISVAVTLAVVFVALNLTVGDRWVKKKIRHLYSIHDAQFQRTMGVLLGPVIVSGNRFETLLNGDEIFPSMLQAIRDATKTITFETYIYWSGNIARAFADALSERARAGINVHVLLDWLGSSRMDEGILSEMHHAGVHVRRYHAPKWYNVRKLNNRTHRKILVIDGRIGFTGGVGIATEWTGHAQDPNHWRDSHFRAEGPVVAQMQAVFGDNWVKATGEVLDGGEYFPALEAAGDTAAQMFASSPSGGSESMELMYLLMIAAAVRSIELSSAYFVPDELARDALVASLRRGVRVRIITPGPYIDRETVRRASRANWGALLDAGAEIYEYQPTMYHCKVLVIDGLMVSVGSTNFDARSFHLNDEASLNIYDERFATCQIEVFENDRKLSRRITYDEWRGRSLSEKLWEHAAELLDSQI